MRSNTLYGLALASLLLCLTTPFTANADDDAVDCSASGSRITVIGYGEVEAQPDEAALNFSVRAAGKTPQEARDLCERSVTAFLKGLSGRGIKDDAISAGSISLYPKISYDEKRRRQVNDGYEALREVQVLLTDFSLIPKVTDLAMSSGFNEAPGFTYRVKDDSKFRYAADDKAIADARAQAEHLAKGFGLKLLKPCHLSFMRDEPRLLNSDVRLMSVGAQKAEAPESRYTPGSKRVTSRVTAVYAAQ